MIDQEAHELLTRVFGAVCDPAVTAEQVGVFFTADYVQIADGKKTDRAGFIDHVRVLKSLLHSASVRLEIVIASGSTVASLHLVKVQKKTGEEAQIKVHAFFEIREGLIGRTEELTHVLHGSPEDRDLGSRTSI